MRLDPTLVGKRVTLRRALPGQTGPTGGPAMTDVVGRVLAFESGSVLVERRDGELVRVHVHELVSGRVIPEGARRRRTRPAGLVDPEELAAICTRGWPPVESEPLGDWLLRAASGFTARANSVAVHGDPKTTDADALARITAFYRARSLPPRAQVIVGSPWEPVFAASGWTSNPDGPDGAVVQVADLGEALRAAGPADPDVQVRDHADDDWVGLYRRADGVDPATARRVLEGPPRAGFVRLGDPPVAIARVAVTGEWAGIGCVEVAPAYRRQGMARRVVDAALRWAGERDADKAYLQVARAPAASGTKDGETALALYAPYGFTDHHEYRYLVSN